RVALVGDAAACVSLLAGQGSSLAMTAAYVLAGELKVAGGDPGVAFARYQDRLATFVAGKQRAAERFGKVFAPRSKVILFLVNNLSRTLSVPFIADRLMWRELNDTVSVPTY